jgi:hypothetical protein
LGGVWAQLGAAGCWPECQNGTPHPLDNAATKD